MIDCSKCASAKHCAMYIKNPNMKVKDCGYYMLKSEGEKRKSEASKN